MRSTWNDHLEWLETDGLGGFASGTVGGIRTRRYHGLLLASIQPPTKRVMLVNGLEVTVTTPAGAFALSSQRYAGEVVAPEGFKYIKRFSCDPWPVWLFELPDGTQVEQSILMKHDDPIVAISWKCICSTTGCSISVRPFISGRDYHALHRENSQFDFIARQDSGAIRWQPYSSLPAICARSNGHYEHTPLWYRSFFYQQEWLRGFEATEDLASPGSFRFDLSDGSPAVLMLAAEIGGSSPLSADQDAYLQYFELEQQERRRRERLGSTLDRAADQYVVRRGDSRTIIAGYPWFADWGRDTFIALRGLCLATDRLDDARAILVNWARYISDGGLPNRFPDSPADEVEYNTVDAALWYVIAALEFLKLADERGYPLPVSTRDMILLRAVEQILESYARGGRHGIRLDDDGLLSAGEHGFQLTWMDARVNGREITPRIGKPVEIQALWLNALHLAKDLFPRWREPLKRGIASFRKRFWNPAGYLNDVVDVDHVPGAVDASFRPNQVFAVGGLPLCLLADEQSRAVVDSVEEQLLTPLGLRSLTPHDTQYAPNYSGDSAMRDSTYHQGTAWPWLLGAFVEAWVRVRGSSNEVKRAARRRFLDPLLQHLRDAGLGHISEIADGAAPHMPRGCPFQAWSVAEALRLDRVVLRETPVEVSVKPPPARRHPMRRTRKERSVEFA